MNHPTDSVSTQGRDDGESPIVDFFVNSFADRVYGATGPGGSDGFLEGCPGALAELQVERGGRRYDHRFRRVRDETIQFGSDVYRDEIAWADETITRDSVDDFVVYARTDMVEFGRGDPSFEMGFHGLDGFPYDLAGTLQTIQLSLSFYGHDCSFQSKRRE